MATASTTTASSPPRFADVLKEWRGLRGLSQLQLAGMSEVSQRHLSFLETGRSKPSREMVTHLARALRVDPREHNRMLLSAGFAPRYSEAASGELGDVDEAIEFLLRAHEPNMAIVIDRHWNLVSANAPALHLTSLLPDPPPLFEGELNVMWLMFHPDGFRRYVTNFAEVAPTLLWRVHDDLERTPADETLRRLASGLADLAEGAYDPAIMPAHAGLVATVDFDIDGTELRFFTCIASLEGANDVTVAELRIETFFPADEASRAAWAVF